MSSFNNEEYLKLRKKRLEAEEAKRKANDIAPVKQTNKETEERTWFQKGAFEDGYQFGDVTKTIGGTVSDVRAGLMSGILGIGEKVVDAGAYVVGGVGGLLGADEFQDNVQDFIAKDLYDERAVAEKIVKGTTLDPFGISDVENSVLGEKSDALVESGGQLLGTVALQAVGVPWFVTSGVTSFGSEVENAFNQDASYGEAGLSAAVSAGVEIATEKLFGGSGLGEKGLFNLDGLTKGISNKVVKALADLGVDMAAEGAEEVASQIGSNFASALYQEENLQELLLSEEAFDGYLESFIGGAALGSVANVGKTASSIKTGRDYRTGLTQNEQKVFDKVYEDAVAKAEEGGKELTKKQKSELYDNVKKSLERGEISTDTIEEVLGGDNYKAYKTNVESENSLVQQKDALEKEINELNKMKLGEMTGEQRDRLEGLKDQFRKIDRQIADNQRNAKSQLKSQLSQSTMDVIKKGKDTYLAESYNESARRGQKFEADLTKYKDKQQEIVKKAVESGILNNTRRTHELVDWISKIAADKGVSFDFLNNEKLKGSMFAVNGKTVNGYYDSKTKTIGVNIEGAKYLDTVVGHEVAHVLEGTEVYTELQKALFKYAQSKGEYDSRRKALESLYKEEDIDSELTADLVGDYLFTDADFIKNLSANHRNVFQKLFDEIKYLCKVATAGSKEAKELERVKKLFEEAYREGDAKQKNTVIEDGVQYSLADMEKITPSPEQVDSNMKEVAQMSPVCVVDESKLAPNGKDFKEIYGEYFIEWGENIHTDLFGDIAAKKSSIRSEIRHGSTAEKIAAIEAIPSVIQNGKIVDWIEKQRGVYRIIVAAPISIGDTPYVMGVMLQRDSQYQRLYLHDVVIEKEASISSQDDLITTGSGNESDSLYTTSILQKILNVKRNSTSSVKNSLSSIANTFFGDENMSAYAFQQADYKQTQGYKDYVEQCVNNYRQTRTDYDEGATRKEIEDSIDGIIQVAVASKKAGYDIYDDATKRNKKDSKNRLLFSSLEPNSDYFTSSDISTICDKRQNFAEIYDDIVRAEEAKGVPKGKRFFDNVDNYFYLHKLMADKGLTQPCRQCYVESMRKNLAPMANAFIRLVGETDPNNTANDQLYAQKGKNKGELKSNNAATREWVREKLAEYDMTAESLTVEMLTTEDGLAQLKIQAPLIYEAFNSFYGQSKPKMPKSATPFRFGELTALLTDNKGKIKQSLVNKINSTGGFRLQSYSDFQIQNYTDVLQVIFEAGTLGLNGHAYTKVPAFLDATEGTNLKRNISIFMYKDGNEWKLDSNDSFPYSLEEIYDIINSDETGNTSIIAVSQNNEMSAWIMANDNVGYGIPFHKSGMKMGTVRETIVKEGGREIKGYSETKDHTKQQTEVWAKTTDDHKAFTKVKNGINIYSFWDFNNADGLSKNELIEKNIKAYIDACEEAGYIPKFRDYVMNNGKVLNDVLRYSKELGSVPYNATIEDISFEYKGYTIPYGYYKFLGDFGMFTPDGNASPQQALSLKNYDFAKAVEFFSDSETLRRNEVLQQFSNGEERQRYRDSDLTAEQLMEIVKQKRGEIAQNVVDGKRSLSMEGEVPSKYGNISGDDVRLQAPTQENIAPIPEDIAKTATTTPTIDAEEEAEEIAPVADTEEASEVPKSDNLERAYAKIDKQLEQDKVALAEELEQKKETMREQLKDKNAYISNRAKELYNELSNLKKGVRASNELGYLLDHGFDWNTLKSTLLKVSRWSDKTINPNSVEESTVREMLNEEYDGKLYDLDDIENEYQERVAELDKRAGKEKGEAQKADKRIKRAELHQRIVNGIKAKFTAKGLDLDEALKKAKDLSTFATVDNTPQRVMEKSLGYKAGQTLADETVNKVAQNETEGIKWLNSFTDRKNGLLAKISKQYNIKPGSKESAAAQMYAEGFYVAENGDRIEYGDFQLAKDFPDARTQANIKGLASDTRIREIYDETLKAINESRVRNGYPEIPRLDNYFLHFRAMDDTFSRLGLPFNPNDIRAKDLPTDLNGVTADLKPGQPYFASAMHRRGQRTSHDLIGGLERYLSSAKNQIYHIDDIQTMRALRNYIADNYGQAKGLESLDSLTEEEAQEKIKQVYDSHLSTFAKFLNEEANILAGKTSLIDRGLEGIIGRRGITFLDTVNKQVGSNMVGFNISSALTNLIAPVQAFTKMNKAAFVKGFAQTISNRLASIKGKGDGFAENSPVMIRRQGADRFARTPFQKAADVGYTLMGAVDSITTEIIARAKYNELIAKGYASEPAHIETDKWVSRLMGDRSLGQMPQVFNSKMLGLVTKFQLEVRNQLDSGGYDTVQEAKVLYENIENKQERNAKIAAKVASQFFQFAVAQHIFGQVFESIVGYNPALDIIEALAKAFGLDDDEEDEDTALDNIEQGFLTLLEDMPYTSVFMDGGRIPISSALPIGELITGEDEYGNEKPRLETLGEIAPYYVLPGGYGQIKKSVQGLSMFSDDHPIAGSYTDSGNLRFPVEDTFGNRVKAGIFGQWASKNARDYLENERSPLNEKQIKEYADVDLPIADYWDYREGLSGLSTLAEKADYINSLDIETWQKNLLINNIANRKTNIDLSDYEDYGSFEEFDYAKNSPGMYALSKAVAGNFATFRKYGKDLNNIRTDKDENGKPISGSRKEKVIDYINSLEDTEYGERIILYKTQYKSDNTYNVDILEYLNSRNDLTYEERVAILKELGFKISSDGKKASW